MKESIHQISRAQLSFEDLQTIILEEKQIELSQESIQAIEKCRAYLDAKVAKTEKPIYGVNTGFGSLCNHSISEEDLS